MHCAIVDLKCNNFLLLGVNAADTLVRGDHLGKQRQVGRLGRIFEQSLGVGWTLVGFRLLGGGLVDLWTSAEQD